MNNMKAAVWHGVKDIRVEPVENAPPPPAGWVKVKVLHCGICGSDLHEYLHGPVLIMSDRAHPLTGQKPPLTLGHEFSGEVVALGEGVTRLNLGERVTCDAVIYCGECRYCKEGKVNLCEKCGGVGLHSDGAFAEYVSVPEFCLHSLPDALSSRHAALVEPLAVAHHSLSQADFQAGQSLLILGAGPIGLSVLLMAKALSAGQVLVVEVSEQRKTKAEELGADRVFDPSQVQVVKEIMAITDRKGVDAVVDCAGVQAAYDTGLRALAKGGTMAVTGISIQPIAVDPMALLQSERKIVGVIGYRGNYKTVIDMLALGAIDVEPLITGEIKLENIVEQGFEELNNHKESHVKILVSP